jgi:hypothetical protein
VNRDDKSEELLDMDDRYGRKPTTGKFVGKAFIVTLVLALLAWLLWAANFHSDPAVRVNLISFKAVNEKSIGINFQVIRRDPANEVECRLIAVDIDKYIVGEQTVRVPAGKKNEKISAVIPTRSLSVSASVSRCVVTS